MVMSIETFLGSTIQVGILRVLIQRDMPLPTSRIAREIRSNYVSVRAHTKPLMEAELITALGYGKRTLYKANKANPQVSAFKAFIEAWGNAARVEKRRGEAEAEAEK